MSRNAPAFTTCPAATSPPARTPTCSPASSAIRVLPQARRLAGRFEADRQEREKLAARFFDALREGDV